MDIRTSKIAPRNVLTPVINVDPTNYSYEIMRPPVGGLYAVTKMHRLRQRTEILTPKIAPRSVVTPEINIAPPNNGHCIQCPKRYKNS
ncbi:hypothetical protein CEXT_703731 [Caerostris extrusa]|uniref:Uncharacterized protein n=1 Tax=Caerostris extrusa TaxID=172846 RepID=A0AAV4V007_CAEEX|nr:hypothetical protein CEXT_703731 [Caerostris extrusa]